MSSQTIQTEELPVSVSESRRLVERLSASSELRRAARARTFLLYVCDRTLNHDSSGMHEQEIGVSVFGRTPGYDTGVDNIVRVNATELRKRLEHYFQEEGAAEEIILEIQRGTYKPVFRKRPTAVVASTPPSQATSPPAAERSDAETSPMRVGGGSTLPLPDLQATGAPQFGFSRSNTFWWQAATILLLACSGYLGWELHQSRVQLEPWRDQPALRSFWKSFFVPDAETNVVMADTSFAIAEDIMQRPIVLGDYVDYDYRRFAEASSFTDSQRHDLSLVLRRNTGSVADFRVGQQILALAPTDPNRPALKFAREYAAGEAKRNNLILIGSRQSNPWVGLFADKLNFDLAYNVVLGRHFIVNRHPGPGEPALFESSDKSNTAGTGYAVIAYLPGLSENRSTLIVEGTDSQATGAAGDYLTNEDSMRSLGQRFPGGRIPYFELVMRTSQLNGIPLQGEIIALRTYGGD